LQSGGRGYTLLTMAKPAIHVMTIKVDEDTLAAVDKMSARLGISRSALGRRALIVGLKEAESFAQVMESGVWRRVMLVLAKMHAGDLDPDQLELFDKLSQQSLRDPNEHTQVPPNVKGAPDGV